MLPFADNTTRNILNGFCFSSNLYCSIIAKLLWLHSTIKHSEGAISPIYLQCYHSHWPYFCLFARGRTLFGLINKEEVTTNVTVVLFQARKMQLSVQYRTHILLAHESTLALVSNIECSWKQKDIANLALLQTVTPFSNFDSECL